MSKFRDELSLTVKAGNGGPGCISFRHEKFVEYGGPDGGDGGDGGCLYIQSTKVLNSLSHLKPEKNYKAGSGSHGMGVNRSGKKGNDLIIKVPLGTQLIDPQTNEILYDFVTEEKYNLAEGARGGKGNAFFKSATRQAPRLAQPGEKTEAFEILLRLKLIAQIGLVGLPNAGKSSLLSALTNAKPETAPYPFTTISPNLGVIEDASQGRVTLADIPGIIEGASKGLGLGLSFLKHMERVKLIIFVMDINASDVPSELDLLFTELAEYGKISADKARLLVLNKIDLLEDQEFLSEYLTSLENLKMPILTVSAKSGEGINKLRDQCLKLLR